MRNDEIIKFFARDQFAAYIGAKLVNVEPGYALAEMELSGKHLNGVNLVQGGAIFTLADFAFAAAANACGKVTVGINATISYFKSPGGKKLFAEAKEISASNKLASYNVDVFDENKETIARFIATGFRKEEEINFSNF